MSRVGPVLGALALALVLGACGRGSSPGEGTLNSHGDVRVARLGDVPVRAGASIRLRSGDRVVVRDGDATVALPGRGTLDLRSGSDVVFQSGPSLAAGDILVQSSHAPVRVQTTLGDVRVDGVGRIRRNLALEVGTYKGRSTVSSGRVVEVPWLREETVPSVGVTPEPVPLRLDRTDRWDNEFLGLAIYFTDKLEKQSSYVTANAPPGSGDTAAFYERSLRPLAGVFNDSLLQSVSPVGRPQPGDALVAASIALSSPGPFAERWQAVFGLRQLGAQWGVVVLDQAADSAALESLVRGFLNVAPLVPESPGATAAAPISRPASPAPTVAPGVHTTTTTTKATTTTAPHPGPGHRPPPTTSPPLTVPPVTVPPGVIPGVTLPPQVPPIAPVIDPVVNIVRSLLGTPPGH